MNDINRIKISVKKTIRKYMFTHIQTRVNINQDIRNYIFAQYNSDRISIVFSLTIITNYLKYTSHLKKARERGEGKG